MNNNQTHTYCISVQNDAVHIHLTKYGTNTDYEGILTPGYFLDYNHTITVQQIYNMMTSQLVKKDNAKIKYSDKSANLFFDLMIDDCRTIFSVVLNKIDHNVELKQPNMDGVESLLDTPEDILSGHKDILNSNTAILNEIAKLKDIVLNSNQNNKLETQHDLIKKHNKQIQILQTKLIQKDNDYEILKKQYEFLQEEYDNFINTVAWQYVPKKEAIKKEAIKKEPVQKFIIIGGINVPLNSTYLNLSRQYVEYNSNDKTRLTRISEQNSVYSGLENIKKLKQLKFINISAIEFDFFEILKESNMLTHITWYNFNKGTLGGIKNLKNLESMIFSAPTLYNASAHIANLPNLETVIFTNCKTLIQNDGEKLTALSKNKGFRLDMTPFI